MMTFLGQVRAREENNDDLGESIKEIIELLKSYGYEVPPSIYAMLDDLPERWILVKKMARSMKQNIAPVQNIQMDLIQRRIVEIDRKQENLRRKFLLEAPFRYDTSEPYDRK